MIKNSPKMSSKIDKIDEQRLSETILFFDVVFLIFLIDFGSILGSISDHSWVNKRTFFCPRGSGGPLGGPFGHFFAILGDLGCFWSRFGVDLGALGEVFRIFLKGFFGGGEGGLFDLFRLPSFSLLACMPFDA